ncbi:Beige/BEACH domain [Carpediemonas membranifera]|uniref:Beige/BEACH domain n=1 Tax=Carpediemonas membranifera TaxID=201153 RepID=A0A8J6B8W3_9EUKA|nr:Beige/BEACH domain [Carpediemonas membranifera]|eukprot:KAG9395609.1 Beige/BEACH domain [Carpediemonas membranifera]
MNTSGIEDLLSPIAKLTNEEGTSIECIVPGFEQERLTKALTEIASEFVDQPASSLLQTADSYPVFESSTAADEPIAIFDSPVVERQPMFVPSQIAEETLLAETHLLHRANSNMDNSVMRFLGVEEFAPSDSDLDDDLSCVDRIWYGPNENGVRKARIPYIESILAADDAAYTLRPAHTIATVVRFNHHLLDETRILVIACGLIETVRWLHRRGLYHGGLTPDTVGLAMGFVPRVRGIFPTRTPPLQPPDVVHRWEYTLTHQWAVGSISNLEYLRGLNHMAGRRDHNPFFASVYPWVVDFTSPNGGWRDLRQSMFRLHHGDATLDATFTGSIHPHHVSGLGSEVTYFSYLARRTPLSDLVAHVRARFNPAEYPSTVARMFKWTADEAIIDFYSNPDMFASLHDELPDLGLPPFAPTPEEFISWHRSRLEHHKVSARLHRWIDITFGVGLLGQAAEKNKNVPAQWAAPLDSPDSHMSAPGYVALFHTPHPPHLKEAQSRADRAMAHAAPSAPSSRPESPMSSHESDLGLPGVRGVGYDRVDFEPMTPDNGGESDSDFDSDYCPVPTPAPTSVSITQAKSGKNLAQRLGTNLGRIAGINSIFKEGSRRNSASELGRNPLNAAIKQSANVEDHIRFCMTNPLGLGDRGFSTEDKTVEELQAIDRNSLCHVLSVLDAKAALPTWGSAGPLKPIIAAIKSAGLQEALSRLPSHIHRLTELYSTISALRTTQARLEAIASGVGALPRFGNFFLAVLPLWRMAVETATIPDLVEPSLRAIVAICRMLDITQMRAAYAHIQRKLRAVIVAADQRNTPAAKDLLDKLMAVYTPTLTGGDIRHLAEVATNMFLADAMQDGPPLPFVSYDGVLDAPPSAAVLTLLRQQHDLAIRFQGFAMELIESTLRALHTDTQTIGQVGTLAAAVTVLDSTLDGLQTDALVTGAVNHLGPILTVAALEAADSDILRRAAVVLCSGLASITAKCPAVTGSVLAVALLGWTSPRETRLDRLQSPLIDLMKTEPRLLPGMYLLMDRLISDRRIQVQTAIVPILPDDLPAPWASLIANLGTHTPKVRPKPVQVPSRDPAAMLGGLVVCKKLLPCVTPHAKVVNHGTRALVWTPGVPGVTLLDTVLLESLPAEGLETCAAPDTADLLSDAIVTAGDGKVSVYTLQGDLLGRWRLGPAGSSAAVVVTQEESNQLIKVAVAGNLVTVDPKELLVLESIRIPDYIRTIWADAGSRLLGHTKRSIYLLSATSPLVATTPSDIVAVAAHPTIDGALIATADKAVYAVNTTTGLTRIATLPDAAVGIGNVCGHALFAHSLGVSLLVDGCLESYKVAEFSKLSAFCEASAGMNSWLAFFDGHVGLFS